MQYSFDGEYCEMAGGDMYATYSFFQVAVKVISEIESKIKRARSNADLMKEP